ASISFMIDGPTFGAVISCTGAVLWGKTSWRIKGTASTMPATNAATSHQKTATFFGWAWFSLASMSCQAPSLSGVSSLRSLFKVSSQLSFTILLFQVFVLAIVLLL